jgi:hypothetical protein
VRGRHRGGALLALALAFAVAAGCGDEERWPLEPSHDLSGAQKFRKFPLFFAGRRVGDLPLTSTQPNKDNPYRHPRPVTFAYGFCEPPPGDEGGCGLPLSIQNFHASSEHLARYDGMIRPRRLICIRGVRAGVFEHEGNFDKLLLTTGRTTVVIFAPDAETALRVAGTLRSVGKRAPAELLPAPSPRIDHRTGAPCPRPER